MDKNKAVEVLEKSTQAEMDEASHMVALLKECTLKVEGDSLLSVYDMGRIKADLLNIIVKSETAAEYNRMFVGMVAAGFDNAETRADIGADHCDELLQDLVEQTGRKLDLYQALITRSSALLEKIVARSPVTLMPN